ncbi:MAG: hypothetical protein ACREIT_01650 [Tepidisphaeraceae bacterium]
MKPVRPLETSAGKDRRSASLVPDQPLRRESDDVRQQQASGEDRAAQVQAWCAPCEGAD